MNRVATGEAALDEDLSSRFQALHEIVAAAHQALDRNMWDYIVGGAGTETTIARNRSALDQLAFRPRILRDVSKVDCTASLFGKMARLPVFLAPIGGLDSIAENGCMSMAEAAAAFGVPFLLSSVSQDALERTAEVARNGTKIFQLYVRGDSRWVDDYARRATDAGFDAFCLTVDSAHYSRRERDLANRFDKRWRAKSLGMEFQAALNWNDIARFKRTHRIPLILKGLMTAEDADLACQHEVEAIIVSNHGGRQLDHTQGTMDVLAEITAAVGGRAKVFIDGGFNRGSDVIKAVALGADGVGIGRLFCFGLAAAGKPGVIRVLQLLEAEMVECLGLLGVARLADLDKSYLAQAQSVSVPGVVSAFPLLSLAQHKA